MREIKFREWETERKTMVVGKREDYDDSVGFRFEHEEGGERILLQYTGLKDTNGVEIYEGDILKNRKGKNGYVNYLQQEAGYVVVTKDSDYRLGHRNTNESYNQAQYHEVIGNIHENPDLISN